ncbi:P1 family peptidase [Paenibacillus apiarius]|uniref:P1 family peptidase n=1 Tax=Paenibacillus apiarius TaxID=46240 RepID=UPI0019824785|nr:P1 family peptidase [Paenibacillus apiarius]
MKHSDTALHHAGGKEFYPGCITDVSGIKLGNAQDDAALTGCTVIIAEEGAVCGVDVRGSAPGTRETELLHPTALVQHIHALCLSGGSAFGLEASHGVMRYLKEQGIGLDVGVGKVPIVPSAILFDLGIGDPNVTPNAAMGYAAARDAIDTACPQGNIGAGMGATVGKYAGPARVMKGGFGTASVQLPGGLVVGAAVAVNAIGEVRDPKTGMTLAGARQEAAGSFIEPLSFLTHMANPFGHTRPGTNTTIAALACNGDLTKTEMTKVAQMAHNGLARTIYPVHTMYDGDTVFAMTTGGVAASVDVVGIWAAEVLGYAVHNAIIAAESAGGVPAWRDWQPHS